MIIQYMTINVHDEAFNIWISIHSMSMNYGIDTKEGIENRNLHVWIRIDN